MKKLVVLILLSALIVIPVFSRQADADREIARTQKYIEASTKPSGPEKINALKTYIKDFPETTSRWTKLAYYSLATEYFQSKNYAEAIKVGEQTLAMGSIGAGEDARLTIVIANCYAIKNSPSFDQDKALKYTNQALTLAKEANDNQVKDAAEKLKAQLSAPIKPNLPPDQKFKGHYAREEYAEAITVYNSLSATDKANPELRDIYARSLLKEKKYDAALTEFNSLYAKDKKGMTALRIGEVYTEKGKKVKTFYDQSVQFYLEAAILFQKEGNSQNVKIAMAKAEYDLAEKYDFNKKAKMAASNLQKGQSSAKKNEAAILKLKKDLRAHQKRLRKEYEDLDMAPPPFEEKKTKDLEDKIAQLESGVSTESSDEIAKLEAERAKIQKELDGLKTAAKKRLGL